jgi:hypothetical protein
VTGTVASGLDGPEGVAREGKGCPLFIYFEFRGFLELAPEQRWREGRILETFSNLIFRLNLFFQSLQMA